MSESHDDKSKNTARAFSEGGITRFGERLSTLINGESYKSFAKKCDMSDKAIRDYVAGKTYPALDRIAHIAKVAGCSFEWLATGYGSNELLDIDLHLKRVKHHTPTPEEYRRWTEMLDLMTPDEREVMLYKISRNGLNFLLQNLKPNKLPNNKDTTEGLSPDDLLIARMYSSLEPEQRKSFLESIIRGEHKKTDRSLSSKTKAS